MSESNIAHLPAEYRSEFSVNDLGQAFATKRAVARLAGVSHVAIINAFQEFESGKLESSKLAKVITESGFEGGNLIPDTLVSLIIGYYAMDAGRYCTEQAKLVYKAFAAVGFRAWVQKELGWTKPQPVETPQLSETIQMLTLQNEVLGKELSLRQLDNTMLTIHGKEVVLALRGYQDQVVKVEIVVTEVCDVQKGTSEKILTAKQLKSEVKKRTGFDIGSQTEFVKKLREAGRDDLIIPVDRKVTNEYVKPECLDEAISVFFANHRQILIGE